MRGTPEAESDWYPHRPDLFVTQPDTMAPDDGTQQQQLFYPESEKPYHTKRPHRKSRAGCRNCKTRKVKCDEARPSCRACTLRKEHCSYPTTSSSSASASASSPRA